MSHVYCSATSSCTEISKMDPFNGFSKSISSKLWSILRIYETNTSVTQTQGNINSQDASGNPAYLAFRLPGMVSTCIPLSRLKIFSCGKRSL